MKLTVKDLHLDKIFICILLIIFYLYNLFKIDYGLPFFLNLDETRFQYSTLSYLSYITGHYHFGDPIIAPLISLILIFKSIFINELLLNALSIQQIESKIYFNPEIFILFGRVASLTIASFSIFILYLIFKKLKINFLIYSILLLTFASSLVVYNVTSYFGKPSHYLLIFLIQLYFFFKYLIKINSFSFKSYIIFSILGSIAWGITFWPAFISIYAVLILHYEKFKFSKIHYLFTFSIIFILFGPILGILFSDENALRYMASTEQLKNFELISFFKITINKFLEGLRIIYFADKNILLMFIFLPFFLLIKEAKFKKEFFIILVIFFEPIILFSISQNIIPQLRYYVGNISIIIILTSIIFNELYKSKYKFFYIIFIISNCFFIYNNIYLHNKIDNVLSKNHSFYTFNDNISQNRKKILYLVDLGFQESLVQNELYLKLYKNDLIKKNKDYQNKIFRIKDKINKIKNTKNIIIDKKNLKKDITYFNFTYHEIKDLELFFDFIKKDFDYVVIEESESFYLTNEDYRKKINKYVKDNFIFHKIHIEEDKIFFTSQMSIVHFFANAITVFDYAKNIDNKNLDIVYGSNYSIYKIN